MAASLPPVPRFVFTIIEPVTLVAGFLGVVVPGPDWFVGQQIVQPLPAPETENSRLVALQLGNLYLLLALVGVAVLSSTTEPKAVRNYLIALWIADVGHIGLTAFALGHQRLADLGQWNAVFVGNIIITGLLCLTRTAYLLGFFEPDTVPVSAAPKILKDA